TGIDLPFERTGFFPNTDWYTKHYGRYFSSVGLKANLVIGQGEALTTPLAVCNYYAAIANDGIWQSPHLLERVFNESSIYYEDILKKNTKQLPISEKNLKIIQKSLYDTVYRHDGTGHYANVKGAEVYAKTGSAENSFNDLTHAYFVGYAKWDNVPEIAFLVFIENIGHGGSNAGPIARKIIQFYQDNVRTQK
ncbi:MAG: penicillin-binding transpeptidase domain-containing protein, partial [Candidatus Cloacimonetes bacterium]|nr:penicillin-binding transpeptidase domain-containing protein [Candidatus Cloacimonadota bacterium]